MQPLHAAVQKENPEIIQLLLEKETIDAIAISIELSNDPDANGKPNKRRERTALDIAIENKSLETIMLLTTFLKKKFIQIYHDFISVTETSMKNGILKLMKKKGLLRMQLFIRITLKYLNFC